ncbi:MAG: glycosyltransferase family 39 protein [Chloroflexi bacterium]|nr:glycosyltransferase family 39 protein [Chloroflexota bacterium]
MSKLHLLPSQLRTNPLLLALVLFNFMLHALTNTSWLGYGYFRDELYYLICADRLAWGYVDHPPLSIFVLALSRLLFGASLFALRLLPALIGALVVILTGLMARQLGGGKWAQALAALAIALAPIHLIMDSFYSMNAFEIFFWTLSAYLFIVLLTEDKPKRWLAIGLVIGLGLENKHTMLTFALALAVGLVLTPARQYLKSKWLWLGGLLAVLLLTPNLIWQAQHGFPSLEFYQIAEIQKNVPTGPLEVFLNQLLVMNPVTAPLWLAGLGYYLFAEKARTVRALGILYLVLLGLLFVAQSSRPDRIAGAYPMLLAAGAVGLEQLSRRYLSPTVGRRLALTGALLLGLSSIVFIPVSVPLLPPAFTSKLALAVGAAQEIERGKQAALPQYMADRFGWVELVNQVATIYHQLSPQDQAKVIIFTDNYGEASAINVLGRAYGLPPAISGHNNYFLWGPGNTNGEIVIAIGGSILAQRTAFAEIAPIATFQCAYCIENGVEIYLAKHLKIPVNELWPTVKDYE